MWVLVCLLIAVVIVLAVTVTLQQKEKEKLLREVRGAYLLIFHEVDELEKAGANLTRVQAGSLQLLVNAIARILQTDPLQVKRQ